MNWISASTPPERVGNVLITDGNHTGIGCFLPRSNTWQKSGFMGDVRYWMVLPRPPNGE